ncbi:MAG: hypothetical protein MK226_06155 [Saprospiraceae bacterium]|nr:hypothetical protein [Saprospiraceae bacterium]
MNLINTETGEELQGVIQRMSLEEILTVKNDPNFIFNWPSEKENEVYKIQLFNQEEILGLISLIESANKHKGKNKKIDNIPACLIAFTCRKVFLKDYEDFVSLTPKTNLIEYYHIKFGFIESRKSNGGF